MTLETKVTNNNPRRFRMPAEWETQAATWVSWPHNAETWPDNLAQAQHEFVDFVKSIATTQPVNVMVGSPDAGRVRAHFSSNINIIEIETNDAWARDYAPTFVRDTSTGKLASVDWHYNAWGGKYPPFDADQKVASKIADQLGIENIAGGLCLEGGALEVNSQGVLLTTESCVLNPNRNPGIGKDAVQESFNRDWGVRKSFGFQATSMASQPFPAMIPMGISTSWLASPMIKRLCTRGPKLAIRATMHSKPIWMSSERNFRM